MFGFLVLGAGKSSPYLIETLASYSREMGFKVTVADLDSDLLAMRCRGLGDVEQVAISDPSPEARADLIEKHDCIISLLPPGEHMHVARQCLQFKKNLITASYVSPEMDSLDEDAKQSGLTFLNECGLDPGIDHMSALEILDDLNREGGIVESFKSACGGLLAPQSENNPWRYKFSWNPRNVVLAGQGGAALYLLDGRIRICPPHKLFSSTFSFELPNVGQFDMYANRDSLTYRRLYQLDTCHTFIRGTLRESPFCKAWDCLVLTGLTDDSAIVPDLVGQPRKRLLEALGYKSETEYLNNLGQLEDEVEEALKFLNLFSEDPLLFVGKPSPAGFMQFILEEKWKLSPSDKDRIVLVHEFLINRGGKQVKKMSWLVEDGKDSVYTAMARTVGIPLAEAAILFARKHILPFGVLRPLIPSIYEPIMKALRVKHQFNFQEITTSVM